MPKNRRRSAGSKSDTKVAAVGRKAPGGFNLGCSESDMSDSAEDEVSQPGSPLPPAGRKSKSAPMMASASTPSAEVAGQDSCDEAESPNEEEEEDGSSPDDDDDAQTQTSSERARPALMISPPPLDGSIEPGMIYIDSDGGASHAVT
jgi:hypothetical protein